MLDCDVTVVGAGPAGSAVARGLAASGFRVIILEEHQRVGEPMHCSGLVTPRTLEAAGLGDDLVLNEVKGAEVYGPRAGPLILGNHKRRALVIDRIGLDRQLAQRAVEAGAEIRLGHRLESLEPQNGGIRTVVTRNGSPGTLNTRLVVGADGWRSRVATYLNPPKGELIWCFGGEARLPGHPEDRVRIYIGEEVAPGWFAWTIPLGRDRVRLGIGTTVGPKAPKPRHLFNALRHRFPNHFRFLDIRSYSGGFIPLYSPVPTYGSGMMLVGDAARQVKPSSGGGIYTSLVAAKAAVTTAIEALQRDDTSPEALAPYVKRWKRDLGGEFERCARLRAIYQRLQSRQLEPLLQLLSHPVLRAILNRYGDIDYPSKVASHLLKVAGFVIPLLRLPGRQTGLDPLDSFGSNSASGWHPAQI